MKFLLNPVAVGTTRATFIAIWHPQQKDSHVQTQQLLFFINPILIKPITCIAGCHFNIPIPNYCHLSQNQHTITRWAHSKQNLIIYYASYCKTMSMKANHNSYFYYIYKHINKACFITLKTKTPLNCY